MWQDRRRGGNLHLHLRGARKLKRKRYGGYDSRGRLAGKRHLSERPASVQTRRPPGHGEIDTVLGSTGACVVTLVERQSGYLLVGKMRARTTAELNRATLALINRHPEAFRTITADHGTSVPRLPHPRSGHRRAFFLRHAASLLGTRHQL